jgi:arginine decarboxylase
MESWNVEKSRDLYRIGEWSGGYFDVNTAGNVTVRPTRDAQNPEVDLFELTQSLQRRGIDAPILFRFDGIIQDRAKHIQTSFENAMKGWGFNGAYRICYPIKVNPLRHVVDTIRKAGFTRNIGLEVGSKPELLAVLALHDLPDAPLLCNGYKDLEYIELALTGRKLGRRTIIIVEQFYELEQVIVAAEKMGVQPEIGLRMKPYTRGGGYWDKSSGDQAKFGLTTTEVLTGIEILTRRGDENWVKLLHFHVGSQIPSINSVRKVLKEATRMYVEIARLCPSLSLIDIGGGLGIDYDGSKTNFESSMNYSIEEYAESVVGAVYEACDKAGLAHPDIVSESGRALVAHHAVLVAEVIDVATAVPPESSHPAADSDHEILVRFDELRRDLNVKNLSETLNEALSLKDDLFDQFVNGRASLEIRSQAERRYRQLCGTMVQMSRGLKHFPEGMERLEGDLRDTFFCNFSLFQSMLDSWAIDQLFPIMPIQNLKDEPLRRAVLADLTCDSDGAINRFIDRKDVKDYLPCHDLPADRPYYMGFFLVGAYQEILGGLHNLFGDTNAVHVRVGADGAIELSEVVRGDSIKEVLKYVEYDVADLEERFRVSLEHAIKHHDLRPEESARILKRYRESLEGYTYLVK